jgi:hypothetical protein
MYGSVELNRDVLLDAAERSGRAAAGGWWLYVYGPGCVRAFGQLPR